MARMYSSGRGESGSTRPRKPATGWVSRDSDEVESLVEKLAGQEMMPSEIGAVLRDRYGIPSVKALTDKTVTEILRDKGMGIDIPEDLYQLLEKAVAIRNHLDENGNDLDAKRRFRLVESKIRRLADYYRGKELPEDWNYTLQRARLIVE
ncbi:MAG: 30S ribosomal protein S15 [Candidatus Nanohaloarchaea archaeon]|nr:30S ribosomal protein S15 [Candidatus Nanohaloarchaea archaeon]